MRIQAKQKIGKKFKDICLDNLKGRSLIDYCADEFNHVTLALYDDDNDKPNLIISNRLSDKEIYENKNMIYYYAEHFQQLLTDRVCPNVILNVIEGSSFIEVKTVEPAKE